MIIAAATIGGYLLIFPADQIHISNVPDEIKGNPGDTIDINGNAHTSWSGYYEIVITSPSGLKTVKPIYPYITHLTFHGNDIPHKYVAAPCASSPIALLRHRFLNGFLQVNVQAPAIDARVVET